MGYKELTLAFALPIVNRNVFRLMAISRIVSDTDGCDEDHRAVRPSPNQLQFYSMPTFHEYFRQVYL